ncbi:DUF1489 domain-containing protein [Elioraea tepida]|jgi:hypothetical protein|uniref:DUF1489 domain-containing protein n=1 Tax=Elioraea tepida TaxID=2843330 RepID=A0A975U4W4_9PROT|nr:DUF1489 domain-containing protein [Elioraea tepida]QXM25101.1 DUF1489 domain-containing protein [Elioraea tepida]
MLHLLKLAAGCATVEDLADRQTARAKADPPLRHHTRSFPRRAEEIAGRGSIFWVIGGFVQVRQRITAIGPDLWDDGSPCCALHLDPVLVPVEPRPVKPFQGWRYLEASEAPPDVARGARASAKGLAAMSARMRQELAELGLI